MTTSNINQTCKCLNSGNRIVQLVQCNCNSPNANTQQMFSAQLVSNQIGQGVRNALHTCERFLGLDRIQEQNADIHTEYIVTVKVAERFASADTVVNLENQMKELKSRAKSFARYRNIDNLEKGNNIIKRIEDNYKFGQIDTQRLDISVAPHNSWRPPYLMVEVKLGANKKAGILEDMRRIVKLLEMFQFSGALDKHTVYGAVVFHIFYENVNQQGLTTKSKKLLEDIESLAIQQVNNNAWLKYRIDRLDKFSVEHIETRDNECNTDEPPEDKKKDFAFTPCLVLFGNAADI